MRAGLEIPAAPFVEFLNARFAEIERSENGKSAETLAEQLEEGVNPLYISRNMGHASLQVTDNYFKGLPQSRVVQELRGRPIPRVSMFDVLRGEGARVSDRAHRPSTPDLMGALSRA